LLKQQRVAENIAVRFVYEGQAIALRKDSERPGDTTCQHEGRTVLVLDARIAELLAKDTLDLADTKLTLTRTKNGE
jgi:hypothetical protein